MIENNLVNLPISPHKSLTNFIVTYTIRRKLFKTHLKLNYFRSSQIHNVLRLLSHQIYLRFFFFGQIYLGF